MSGTCVPCFELPAKRRRIVTNDENEQSAREVLLPPQSAHLMQRRGMELVHTACRVRRPFLKSARRIASYTSRFTQRSFSTAISKSLTSYRLRRAFEGRARSNTLAPMSGITIPFRPQNAQDWEHYKEAITGFYNAMELRGPHGVMQTMEHKYNFKATYVRFHGIRLKPLTTS